MIHKQVIVLPWQFLLKGYLDSVIMINFCMDLKLDFNYREITMKTVLFGIDNAFGDNNKFMINGLCCYISDFTPNLKTEEMLNRRLNSKKPLNVSYLKKEMPTR